MRLGAAVSAKELQNDRRLLEQIVEVTYHSFEKCLDFRTTDEQRYVEERVELDWLEMVLLPLLGSGVSYSRPCDMFLVYRVRGVRIPKEELHVMSSAMYAPKRAQTA